MKNKILGLILIAFISSWMIGCSEDPFSDDYDINFPTVTVSSISNDTAYVGSTITLKGTNLNTVQSVAIGAYNFTIKEKYKDSLHIVIPRVVESGAFTITNIYKREYVTLQVLKPKFYAAKITGWPTEIENGKPFVLKGENVDLLKDVKINGKTLSIVGTASPDKVSYSTGGLDLNIGDNVEISVTPKVGEVMTSPLIPIIKPKTTYVPKQTIMLWDFETEPAAVTGDAAGTFTAGVVDNGFFGKAYEVHAATGNAWVGIYKRLVANNGGKGYDLSSFSKPYLTFLVNTNGKKGYCNPALTIGGTQTDKHLTGQGGQYTDNYMIKTDGWEWRSYDLSALFGDGVKGKVDNIELWFRGGNVTSADEFDIMVDQVMITDGPLNPTLAWDCENAVSGSLFSLTSTVGSGLLGYNQGGKFATYKTTIPAQWKYFGDVVVPVSGLDGQAYANGVWLNFLVNTGTNKGYFQLELDQGSNSAGLHFVNSMGYGDAYTFVPTNNQWVWRSIRVDASTFNGWGDYSKLDLTKPFNLKIGASSGSSESGNFEINFDYFVFTTVPLDPSLNTSK